MKNLKVIGTIARSSIKNCPPEAQFAKMNPAGEFVEMLYRITSVKYSDGTIAEVLQYQSFSGIWCASIMPAYHVELSEFKQITD